MPAIPSYKDFIMHSLLQLFDLNNVAIIHIMLTNINIADFNRTLLVYVKIYGIWVKSI